MKHFKYKKTTCVTQKTALFQYVIRAVSYTHLGVETLFVSENTGVELGEAALTIYGPLGTGGGNEEGLSILCTAGEFDALITGDMNSAVAVSYTHLDVYKRQAFRPGESSPSFS